MRAPRIPADEQYRLIMECRASGLTDYQWCLQHEIKPGTFYNWVKRLRQKGYPELPDAAGHHATYRQEVVKIELSLPPKVTDDVIPSFRQIEPCRIPDSSMELSIAETVLRIPNGTDPVLLRQTLHILKELSC